MTSVDKLIEVYDQLQATRSASHTDSKEFQNVCANLYLIYMSFKSEGIMNYIDSYGAETPKQRCKDLLDSCEKYLVAKGSSKKSTSRGVARFELINELRTFASGQLEEIDAKVTGKDKENAAPERPANNRDVLYSFSSKAMAARKLSQTMLYDKEGKACGSNYMLRSDATSFYMFPDSNFDPDSDRLVECKFERNKDGSLNIAKTGKTMDVNQRDFSVARLAAGNMLKTLNDVDPALLNSSSEFREFKKSIAKLCNELADGANDKYKDMEELTQAIEDSLNKGQKYVALKATLVGNSHGAPLKPITQVRLDAVNKVLDGLRSLQKVQLGEEELERGNGSVAGVVIKNFCDGIQRYTEAAKTDPALSAAVNQLPELTKNIEYYLNRRRIHILKNNDSIMSEIPNSETYEEKIERISTDLARGIMIHIMNRQNPQPSEETALKFVKGLYSNSPQNEMLAKLTSVKNNVSDYLKENSHKGPRAISAIFENPKLMCEMCSKENTKGSIDLNVKKPNNPEKKNPELQGGGINL